MFKTYIKIKNDKKFKDMVNDMTVITYMNRKLDPELTWRKKEQRSVNIFFKRVTKKYSTSIQTRTKTKTYIHS